MGPTNFYGLSPLVHVSDATIQAIGIPIDSGLFQVLNFGTNGYEPRRNAQSKRDGCRRFDYEILAQ